MAGGTASNSNNTAYSGTGNYSKDALSDAELRKTLVGAGFSGQGLENAMKVARAESGGRPSALNPNAGTGDYSMGLFQINMIGDLGTQRNANYLKQYGQYGYTGPESLNNPALNARIAYDISKGGTKWSDAWVNTSAKLGIGGGTPGTGGSFSTSESPYLGTGATLPTASTSGNKTVNITLKIDQASESQAIIFAKRVQSILNDTHSISTIGSN